MIKINIQLFGGRGARSGANTSNKPSALEVFKESATLDKELNDTNTGKSFAKLNPKQQKYISDNLVLSSAMKRDIENGYRHKLKDEWTTKTKSNKYKVTTSFDGEKLVYSVKQGNKILLKNATKGQVANKLANLYIREYGNAVTK